MVQAAVRGAVDFSEARLLDRLWWTQLWWRLDQLEADNRIQIQKMHHAHNTACLDYNLSEKTFNLHWEQAAQALSKTWSLLFPWQEQQQGKYRSTDELLRQAWINRYGDPQDPETQAKIEATVQQLRAMSERSAARTVKPKRLRKFAEPTKGPAPIRRR